MNWDRNDNYVDWLIIYFYSCIRVGMCENGNWLWVTESFDGGCSFGRVAMLEDYHWAFHKGIPLSGWVRMCYAIMIATNYFVLIVVSRPIYIYIFSNIICYVHTCIYGQIKHFSLSLSFIVIVIVIVIVIDRPKGTSYVIYTVMQNKCNSYIITKRYIYYLQ